MLLYFLLTKACRVWNDFFYCNTSIPVAIDCGSLPSIKNGAVDFSMYILLFSCTVQPPLVTCQVLTSPENGQVSFGSLIVSSVAR